MKSTILFLLFYLHFSFAWSEDTLVSFHGSTIALPQGFRELPKDQLANFKATLFNRKLMTVYERVETRGKQRIIIYYDPLSGTSELNFKTITDLKLSVIKESGISFIDLVKDSINHCVYGKTIFLEDTSLFGFSIDANGMLGVQFNNPSGINNKDQKVFERLLTTIQHTHPYHYKPVETPKAKAAKQEIDRSGMLIVLGLLAMAGIGLIRKYVLKRNQDT